MSKKIVTYLLLTAISTSTYATPDQRPPFSDATNRSNQENPQTTTETKQQRANVNSTSDHKENKDPQKDFLAELRAKAAKKSSKAPKSNPSQPRPFTKSNLFSDLKSGKSNLKNNRRGAAKQSPAASKPTQQNTPDLRSSFQEEASLLDKLIETGKKMNYVPPKKVDLGAIQKKIDEHSAQISTSQNNLSQATRAQEEALNNYKTFIENHAKYNAKSHSSELEKQLEILKTKSPNEMNMNERNECARINQIPGAGEKLNSFKAAYEKRKKEQDTISYYQQEIGKLKGRISGVQGAEKQAQNPDNQLVSNIEKLIRKAFGGVSASNDEIQDLKLQISKKIRKGEETEVLFSLIRAKKENLQNMFEELEENISFNSDNDEIKRLRKRISELEKQNSSSESQQISDLNKQIQKLEAELKQKNSATGAQNTTSEETKKEVNLLKKDIQKLKKELFAKEIHSEYIKRSTKKEKKEYKDLKKKLAQTRIKLLKAKRKEAVNAIKQNTNNLDAANNIDFSQHQFTENIDSKVSSLNDDAKALLYLRLMQGTKKHQKLKKPNSRAIASDATNMVSSILNNRIDIASGIGAGDEDTQIARLDNLWATGFYGTSKQKDHNEISGYKGRTKGGSVGADFLMSEDTLLGLAYTRTHDNFKVDSSDHTKAISDILSLYGKMDLSDKINLSMMVSGNFTKITHKYLKLTGTNKYQTTNGKFNNKGLHSRVLLNYIMSLRGVNITPHIGLSYGIQHDGNYTETGSGVHNMMIAAKNTNELIGIVGAKFSKTFSTKNILIIPALTASIENNFNAKDHTAKANYTWANHSATQSINLGKTPKNTYNLGVNLTAKHNYLEVSTEYNYRLKKLYKSHQGALKFKLLF